LSKHFVVMTINGEEKGFYVDSTDRLIDVLRERFGLKSVKEGCGTGDCGLCAVLLDGRLVNSCLALAPQCGGKAVVTLEGLLQDPNMANLQAKFLKHNAAQCGFCTPAMLLAAKQILDRLPTPTREEVASGISGVLCRCTGYYPIIEAILDASREAEAAP